MHILTKELIFPSPEFADEEGLLAFGGDLSLERLLLAYRNGIFPWFSEDDPICWWCPDPRFVLFPEELKISKSMRTVLNTGTFKFTIDKAFEEVIKNCQKVFRKDQPGTWITDEVLEAYNNLHKEGYAHSAETWKNGELVGGLYGVKLGKVFFGESMFSKESNASKFAFIKFVEQLKKQDIQLLDCQVYTEHLESLGARMIKRKDFLQMLTQLIN
jgi:leucyl/phenylalanyl-tRNA--protein transferase